MILSYGRSFQLPYWSSLQLRISWKKDYKSSLISILTGLMIANAIYDLLPIPTETLIVAGILVGLGLGYLFPDHDNEKNKH